MAIVDVVLKQFLKMKINKINRTCDMSPLEDFQDRSIKIVINDIGDDVGFGFENGTIIEASAVTNATVVLSMSVRVFKALLAGKMDTSEIFYSDLVAADGAHLMRDKIILTQIFEYFREVGAV
jgi:hypothetical protein